MLTFPLVISPLSISRTKPRTRAPNVRTHPGAALTNILTRTPATLRALISTITGIEHIAPFASRDLAGARAPLGARACRVSVGVALCGRAVRVYV